MQKTPTANRPHIAVFGKRNVGKSSLINALTNQDLAVVSSIAGTTTDPVYKSMELLPLGPVVMIDTAGIDDTGELGEMRIKKTREVIRRTDLALLVIDPGSGLDKFEKNLYQELKEKDTPVIFVINKADKYSDNKLKSLQSKIKKEYIETNVIVSAEARTGIEKLRDMISENVPQTFEKNYIIGDLINPGEIVVLVTPIDSGAPKGRLILPQVQTIRDVIDHKGISVVTRPGELRQTLERFKRKPGIVVTDSQAFNQVKTMVPDDILLTGFSVLFARYKGDLKIYLEGVRKMEKLQPGSRILIAEACTHRRQEEDIGTVKLPKWLKARISKDLQFEQVSGREYPEDLHQFDLILHCGGCMLNSKEVLSRLHEAQKAGVAIVNYGMAIAWLHGILDRALKPFTDIYELWQKNKLENGGENIAK
ncbi:MAG: [FeFe] hydrogenase H-cluster maturation GTPase HydF [Halanaerobiaceae bacterium]